MRAGVAGAVDNDTVAGGVARLEEPTNRQAPADDVDHAEQPERGAHTKAVRPVIDRRGGNEQSNSGYRERLERRNNELEAHESNHGAIGAAESQAH